jgi:hypothetical protein
MMVDHCYEKALLCMKPRLKVHIDMCIMLKGKTHADLCQNRLGHSCRPENHAGIMTDESP